MFGIQKEKTITTHKVESVLEFTEIAKKMLPKGLKNEDVFFVCIGTDRSTGDAMGPLVGTKLKELGYTNIVGTLKDPVHAMNLRENIEKFPKGKIIIAIDACLGQVSSIGKMQLSNSPIKPGAGVNKDLPAVGDFGITGVVNVGGFMEYFVLQNTRLSLVMEMAEKIVATIHNVLPLEIVKEA